METDDGDGWAPPDLTAGDQWRGSEHLESWPEECAGPEYWAYRSREEVERIVSELVGERTAREK